MRGAWLAAWPQGDGADLLGRVTEETCLPRVAFFARHRVRLPSQPQPNPFSAALDKAEKFVCSNTLAEPLPWQNSTLLRGDADEAVARLKNRHEKTLATMGSGALVRSLMRHDLIDEYVVQMHPLVLGEGRHLFAGGSPLTKLGLMDLVSTNTGVIIATYHPNGAR